ncbi:inositol monophosphatase 1-like protein [Lates japonicus]|uniref:Inositol monophosphatase 1-like protein n=1 Tax=Lates japonicus TaxID=270547 RepID=A0AAD3NL92_LATJO|nr:inositol monophosphatase 1-like protein [Lates japonicus]
MLPDRKCACIGHGSGRHVLCMTGGADATITSMQRWTSPLSAIVQEAGGVVIYDGRGNVTLRIHMMSRRVIAASSMEVARRIGAGDPGSLSPQDDEDLTEKAQEVSRRVEELQEIVSSLTDRRQQRSKVAPVRRRRNLEGAGSADPQQQQK